MLIEFDVTDPRQCVVVDTMGHVCLALKPYEDWKQSRQKDYYNM